MAIDGNKIRKIRMDRGLSRKQLAEQAGLNVCTIEYWESKARMTACNLEKILRVIEVMDCSLQDIVEDGQELRIRNKKASRETD